MSTVGQRLQRARTSRAMTQVELGKRSGVTVVTISRIENDHYGAPRPPTIRKLSEALDVAPGWLLYGERLNDDAS